MKLSHVVCALALLGLAMVAAPVTIYLYETYSALKVTAWLGGALLVVALLLSGAIEATGDHRDTNEVD
jgi:hypothetical protein